MKHAEFQLKNILVLGCFVLILTTLNCTSKHAEPYEDFKTKSPLEQLFAGNQRFKENHPIHPDQTLERLRALQKGQHPFATVISCSDSRIPPELIFDQGLGDLFVIRNAGNIISDYELGSIEYAVEHLETPLVVVMGHTSCGAIGAYLEHQHDTIPNHIQSIVDYIKSEPEALELNNQDAQYYDNAVEANVKHALRLIQNSEPVLKEMIEHHKIELVGLIYNIENGSLKIVEIEK